ncbi:hypothetical protein BVRB_7g172240 [Beta vulgaris subsp. vulgaris]|nr:hypothetical protein BVRB_7g172240 [Beta vulgaris subsp. vulgaris]
MFLSPQILTLRLLRQLPSHVVFVTSSGRRFIAIDGVRVSSRDLYLRSTSPFMASTKFS